MTREDEIEIRALELLTRIGASAGERAEAQRVEADLVVAPRGGFGGFADRLGRAVDYVEVCEEARRVAAAGERSLLETLAEEIAARLLERFPVGRVRVELRKYVVPGTRHVAVRIERLAR